MWEKHPNERINVNIKFCIFNVNICYTTTNNTCSADGNFEVTLATKATIYSGGLVEWKPPASTLNIIFLSSPTLDTNSNLSFIDSVYKSSCEIDVEVS